jgi:hypothetical protein
MRPPRRRPALRALRGARALGWLPLALAAGGAWFLAAERIMHRLGAGDAAAGVGLLAALAVVVTLARWTAADAARASLAALRCPRCAGALHSDLELPRAGAAHPGLRHWSCARCGYAHAESLIARIDAQPPPP